VPGDRQHLIAYLIALAAPRCAQRRIGAVSFERSCFDDDQKLRAMARRITTSAADAEQLIVAVYREASGSSTSDGPTSSIS
jgi:hypothetical protein